MSTWPMVWTPNTSCSKLGSTWSPIHKKREIPFSANKYVNPVRDITGKKKEERNSFGWGTLQIQCDWSEVFHFIFSKADWRLPVLLVRRGKKYYMDSLVNGFWDATCKWKTCLFLLDKSPVSAMQTKLKSLKHKLCIVFVWTSNIIICNDNKRGQ